MYLRPKGRTLGSRPSVRSASTFFERSMTASFERKCSGLFTRLASRLRSSSSVNSRSFPEMPSRLPLWSHAFLFW